MTPIAKHTSTCHECFLYTGCGGDASLGVTSCLTFDPEECRDRGWVDFRNTADFAFRWSETGGFTTPFRGAMSVPERSEMPLYVPVIHHGSRRKERLRFAWVAIPLYAIVRPRRNGTFGCIVKDGTALRHAFGLHESTKIIISGVAPDKYLERLWSWHQIIKLADLLRCLGVQAITVPNFSYFLDAPPVHTLYNRARMLRMAERFSAAGLPVVPHLNGFNHVHWAFWRTFLREQKDVFYVCKEFQTGFHSATKGMKGYESLVRLQDEIGREIHPILIAGQRYLPKLPEDFKSFTVIDSAPFMKTYKRQFLKNSDEIGFDWKFRRTRRGEPLDERLWDNVTAYEDRLRAKADRSKQTLLPLGGFEPPPKRERVFRNPSMVLICSAGGRVGSMEPIWE